MGDAVRRAVEGNPSYKASSFQPRIAETVVESERGAFDPRVTSSIQGGESRTPFPSGVSGSTDVSSLEGSVGTSALLGTGATVQLTADTRWSRTEAGTTVSTLASPYLSASVRQPLLKGAGPEVTGGAVRTASLDLETSRASFRSDSLALASRSIALYLGYAKFLDSVETRRASLEAARRLHAENQGRVRAGLLAQVDLLESELAIAQREADLVESERVRDGALDLLRSFLGLPQSTNLEIEDLKGVPLPEIPPEIESAALMAAMRPDLDGARRSLDAQELRLLLSRDALLPSLDTVGQANLSGLDGGTGNAWGDVGGGRYPAWSLSLQFSYPIGNRSARADARAAEFRVRQYRETLNAAILKAESESRDAYRSVEAKRRAEEAQGKAVSVAATRVESFRKKSSVGLATTRQVLDAETDLVTAREALNAARVDHRLARYEVLRSTGLLAERFGLYPVSRPASSPEVK